MTDGKQRLDGIAFDKIGLVEVLMRIGDTFFFQLLGQRKKIDGTVIRIKIEQPPPAAQYPAPFTVSGRQIGQCPGEVSGQDEVKRLIVKVECLGIHAEKQCLNTVLLRQMTGAGNHEGG